ncbi:m-phase inducer phosphatase dual specificity phosphatase cdc25 [Anaeramoeba flamelloides]|uniref:protein-tyrosine-phosphatase n=1 Tax=Anaeramoeba flamelloides TaxID=1746091 RepID=A0AAV7ZJP5_9EUKA|nr:m-phase inducer phosphatase dual specificity phosphatase cdc25 [Anaeramoeba flamelloides]
MNNYSLPESTNEKASGKKLPLSRNTTAKVLGIKNNQVPKNQYLQPQKESKPLQERYRSLALRKNKNQLQDCQNRHAGRLVSLANKQSTTTSTNLFQAENAFEKKIKTENSTLTTRKKLNFSRNRPRNFNHKTQSTTKKKVTSLKKNIFNQRNPFEKPKKQRPTKPLKNFPNPHLIQTLRSYSPELLNKNGSQNIQYTQNIQKRQNNPQKNQKVWFSKEPTKKSFLQKGKKNPKRGTSLHKSTSFPILSNQINKRKNQQQKTILIKHNNKLSFGILNSTFLPIDEEENLQNSKTDKQTPSDQTVFFRGSESNKPGNKTVSKKINKNKHKLINYKKEKEQEKEKKRDRKQNNTLPKNDKLSGVPTCIFSPLKILNVKNVNRSYSITPQEPFLNGQRIKSNNNNSHRSNKSNQFYLSNPKKKIRKTRIQRCNSFNLSFKKNFDPKIIEQPKKLLPVTNGKPVEWNTISPDTLCDLLDGSYKKKHGLKFSKVIIVDCRFDWEYEGGHISGAKNWNLPRVLLHKLFCKKIRQNVCLVFHCEFSQHRGPKMCQLLRETDRNINDYPNLHYPQLYILEKGYKAFFRHSDRTKKFCYPKGYRKMLTKKYQTQMHQDSRKFKLNLKDHHKRNILSLDDILNWYGSFEQPLTIRHNMVKKPSNLRTSLSSSQQTISTTKTISNRKSTSATTSTTKKITSLSSKRDNTNSSLCRKRPLRSLNRPQRGFTLPFDYKNHKCKEALFNDDLESLLDFESDFKTYQSPNIGELSERFQKETTLEPKQKIKKNISKIRTVLQFGQYPDQEPRNIFTKDQNNSGIDLGMEEITETDNDTDTDTDNNPNKVTRTATEIESEMETEAETFKDNANNKKLKKNQKINPQEEKKTKNEKSNDNNPDSETTTITTPIRTLTLIPILTLASIIIQKKKRN